MNFKLSTYQDFKIKKYFQTKSINKCPHRLSDKLLKSKKERRTVKFNHFTTVRRCVGRIIEILEFRASDFCKFFEKNDRLLKNNSVWLNFWQQAVVFSQKSANYVMQ